MSWFVLQGHGGLSRKVLEWPFTKGGGGVPPPLDPPPLQTKVNTVGKTKCTIEEILSGHFWYTNFSVFPPLF